MMNFDIPLDNLYKFMAIIGALSFLAMFTVPEYIQYKLNIESIELAGEISVLEVDVEVNKYDISSVAEAVNLANKNGKKISESTLKKHQNTIERNKENRKSVALKSTKNNLIEFKNSQLKKWSSYQFYGSIVSLLIMFLGFIFWYLKVQKPIDLINAKAK